MAHEERQDACHSLAAMLGRVKGMQPEPERVHQVFEAICETRRLNKANYAKFRNFLLYGERGLDGEEAVVKTSRMTTRFHYPFAIAGIAIVY